MDTNIFYGVLVWFVMTGGSGYIEPLQVRPLDMSCGLPGAVVGVAVDSVVNPQFVTWPDPGIASLHCRVSIAARVQALPPGEYHVATTHVAEARPWGDTTPRVTFDIDPHTTPLWTRTNSNLPVAPHAPGSPRVSPQ